MGNSRNRRGWHTARRWGRRFDSEHLPQEARNQGISISAPSKGAIQRFGRKVRRRLLWIFIAFGVGASFTWHFRETIFGLLFAPAREALSPYGGLPIFTGPTEMFGATINLAMMGGVIAASPVLTFSGYQLLSPLLNRRQRRFAVIFLPAIFVCFLGGGAFAYFVMLPTGLKFLLHFGDGIAVPVIRITEYMSLVTAMVFWLGVIFELPLIMFLLAKLRIVSYRGFRKFHRYVPAAAFVLSAIITPTFDVVNQTLVAVPIIVLFEVGLFLSWLTGGHPKMARIRAATCRLLRRARRIITAPVRLARRGWTWFTGRCLRLWRCLERCGGSYHYRKQGPTNGGNP